MHLPVRLSACMRAVLVELPAHPHQQQLLPALLLPLLLLRHLLPRRQAKAVARRHRHGHLPQGQQQGMGQEG